VVRNKPEALKRRAKLRAYYKKTIDPNSFPKYKERICKTCGLLKPTRWTSSFGCSGEPEYRTECDDCYLAYLRRTRKLRQKEITLQSRIRRNKLKERCIAVMGGACIKCGYNKCTKALTFHHKDRKTKIDAISVMIGRDISWEKLKEELYKCELICFNCHMEEEDRVFKEKQIILNKTNKK